MLIRQTAIYMIAQVTSAVFGFASVVIFTRMLTPAEYGIYVICLGIAGILNSILFTWVRLSVLRFTAHGGSGDIRQTALAAYCAAALSAPAALALVVLTSGQSWQRALGALTFTLAIGFFEMSQEILRGQLRAAKYVQAAIVRAVCAFIFGNIAVALGGDGLWLVFSAAAAFATASLVYSPAVWQKPRASFDPAVFRQFLAYGLPLTISGLVFSLHAALDRLMVAHFLGDGAAGQYGAAADLARQIILLPASSVASVIVPMAIRALATQGAKAANLHLEDSLELLCTIVMPCVVGLWLVSTPLTALVFGPQFRETGAMLLPILSTAWLFQAISQNYVHSSFQMGNKPYYFLVHGSTSLVLNITLTLPLIAWYGLPGAAVALVLAELGGVIIGFVLARRAYPLPLIPGRLARVIAANAVMGAATYAVGAGVTSPVLHLPAMVAAGALAYLLAALSLNLIGMREKALHRLQVA